MMTNKVVLNEKQFIRLRRVLCCVSLAVSCICLCLLLSGFIPFSGRSTNIWTVISLAFQFVYMGTKPFWYCVASILFAALYVIIAIKIIISIIKGLKGIKRWLISNVDDSITRIAAKSTIDFACTNILLLLLLCVASYAIKSFMVCGTLLAIIIALIITSVIIKVFKGILFKGELIVNIMSAVNEGMILAMMIMFAVFSTNVQVLEVFKAVKTAFMAATSQDVSGTFVFQLLINQVFVPIINIIMLISFVSLNIKINDYEYRGKDNTNGILIRNAIFIGIILVAVGYVNRYTDVSDYIEIIRQNIVLILFTATTFLIGLNFGKKAPDIECLTKEKDEAAPQSEENNNSSQEGENTNAEASQKNDNTNVEASQENI